MSDAHVRRVCLRVHRGGDGWLLHRGGDCDPGDACHVADCISNVCVSITTCDAGVADAGPPAPDANVDARVDAAEPAAGAKLHGGGGCAVGGRVGAGWVCLVMLVLVLGRVRVLVLVLVLVLVGFVGQGLAQSLDAQLFRPPATSGGVGAIDCRRRRRRSIGTSRSWRPRRRRVRRSRSCPSIPRASWPWSPIRPSSSSRRSSSRPCFASRAIPTIAACARNLALSQRRAEAVRDHLIAVHRLASARLMAQGFGPDPPVASNKATAGRARNRRSELIIVERKAR